MSTQRITMAGRPYTFVAEPGMPGVATYTEGHLLNSRHRFAGYVVVVSRTGERLLIGGPSGISRDAERAGLAQIETEETP